MTYDCSGTNSDAACHIRTDRRTNGGWRVAAAARVERTSRLRWMLTVALAATIAAATSAFAQYSGSHPLGDLRYVSPAEIAQLPHFCWGKLNVPGATGPEFNLPDPGDCGWAMNHYCGALVLIIRAKRASKSERQSLLGAADGDIAYTERAMKDYPRCSIRPHVEASRAELENLMVLYGYRGPRAPREAK